MKLSALPTESTFAATDLLIKIKAAGAGDVGITLQDFLAALAAVQPAWAAASYLNSWVDFDTGSPAATTWGGVKYFKDSMGIVHFKGLAKSGTVTVGTTILTLPAGFRPGNQLLMEINSNDVRAGLDINPDGTVKTRAGVSATWVSFNGLSFRAEN